VIKKPKGWPYDCREQDVRRVKDADGKPLDPQEVRTKPGFAVFVERDYTGVREVVVCLNPTAHGYVGGGNGYATPEEEARREAAAQAREERRAALETAAEVRRQFICETYGSPAAAKKLRETVLRDLLGGPQMDLITGGELAAALAGGETDVENAGEVKLLRIMVSRWIAAREHQCHRVAVNGWGDRYRALAWLEWLVAAGYELSEAEAALHDAWSAAYAEQQRQAEHEEGAACGICGAGPDEPCEPECLNVMPVAGEAGDPENGEEPEVPDAEPEGEERTDIDVPEPSDLVEPAVS
jgi:ParB family chromosome partitioning protein